MKNKMIFKLSKEYDLDGKKISEIDFTKLYEADVSMYLKAYDTYEKMGYTGFPPEKNEEFAELLAHKATDLPIEFFDMLLAHDILGITEFVKNIIYSKPISTKNEIVLSRPIETSGAVVDKLDFSNLENITTITLKKANNIIRKRGIYIRSGKEYDMRYALAIAEVISGIDDLSKISIQDGIEIRNRVANFLVLGS